MVWTLIALGYPGTPATADPDQHRTVNYTEHAINDAYARVIWVDLGDKSLLVTPAVAEGKPGRRRSFVGFLADYQPLAQITGSYFSLTDGLPIGDIMIGSSLIHRGPVGSALALRADNSAEIIDIPRGWTYSWPGYESVLQGGIRLLKDGEYVLNPRAQGFRDPGLFRRAARTAVGLNDNNRLLMVAVYRPQYLSEMASIMKRLGCRDAMTLDGGASTGLAYGDSIIYNPDRTISNVLMVVKRPEPPAGQP